MNISTGGPHILLFERDQQLAALLISELQLVGYTCYTARTAVEVFDTIARYPIRLVLVNLAQAAATRREFWVALDTQRRDRKVQVLTFLCTNLAGYGPRDMDDHNPNMVTDVEVDGMLGLMGFVDIIQTRLPVNGGTTAAVDANTLPRIPRPTKTSINTANPSANSTPLHIQNANVGNNVFPGFPQQRPQPTAASYQAANNDPSFRPIMNRMPQEFARQSPPTVSSAPPVQHTSAMPAIQQTMPQTPSMSSAQTAHLGQSTPPNNQSQAINQSAQTSNQANTQPSYTDKIRAILYPNQKTWDSQSGNTATTAASQERKEAPGIVGGTVSVQVPLTPMPPAPSVNSPLQQLANNQSNQANSGSNGNGYGESGLAQLSRLIQHHREPQAAQAETSRNQNAPEVSTQPVEQTNQQPVYEATAASYTQNSPVAEPTPVIELPVEQKQADVTDRNTAHTLATSTEDIPLRASPIQDIPIERTVGAPPTSESGRRPDVFSRTNYNQSMGQPATPAAITAQINTTATPLASIAATPATGAVYTSRAAAMSAWELQSREIEQDASQTVREETQGNNQEPGTDNTANESQDENTSNASPINPHTDAAVLLDIVQSFPPMPEILSQPSSIQPQALNGRATRSLNKVLLEGHLVPQDRLEVAQNIQRMLRGVDLNYQLGEILLMFKLLTPDQLLAASLVSYGLITTTQISALGHIRQELHAIGLEYDLENLLILFRILTPEQLREVRSGLQN